MKKYIFSFVCVCFLFMVSNAQETESLYISGTGSDDTVLWDFYCSAGQNSGKWTKIPVPSNWEFEGFGEFNYGHDKERLNEYGIYKHTFVIPKRWENKKINIVFEGVMTDTEVKINGHVAGETHQGGYYRFKYDISNLLKFGENNLLEVTVHKSSSNVSVENAERNADFWVYGGIYRPVWLEVLPSNHIERVAINADCNGRFTMKVFLGGQANGSEVIAQVKTLNGQPIGNSMRQLIKNNNDEVFLSSQFENPDVWSSEFPNLYKVEVSLVNKGQIDHKIAQKFGFRTVELRAKEGFYINGAKIKFKGVNRHTHWPTTGRASSLSISLMDAKLIKEMNMNAVRMSHYPPDNHFLEVCDSLGLYVIDELTGWQSSYDTHIGQKLVEELITRDVNHPCIVMWANGNEGGFNFDLLPEYGKYDIQERPVIHPWLKEKNTNTHHYPTYTMATNVLLDGNSVFFPTEMLHGLYDGGHGAGLDDFWNLMQSDSLSAGGFLWDFADQGVVRKDMNNHIDTDGNHAADGILGPYREKEGSFFTIKEIFSPVYLECAPILLDGFDGEIKVQNRYNFTNLSQVHFKAKWVKFNYPSGKLTCVETRVIVPDVRPGSSGVLSIGLPYNRKDYDALFITASDIRGREIYTWTRTITKAEHYASRLVELGENKIDVKEQNKEIFFTSADTRITIDKVHAMISEIIVKGKRLSLSNGPRCTDERMELDKTESFDENGIKKIRFLFKNKKDKTGRNIIQIGVLPSGWIEIEYAFDVQGYFDNIGVTFDYPENKVEHVKWLGNGPYRVWKNRLKGVTFNLWKKSYNNTITGESWEYPEFKGFHSNIYAADISTKEGMIKVVMASDDIYLHLFTPDPPQKKNNDNTLGIFPSGELSILNAISPVGTKFKQANELGPQSQRNFSLSHEQVKPIKGKFYIKYEPK